MATKKNPKHSGFEAPAIGTAYPKGSTLKRMPDGTMKVVAPRKSASKRKK